MMNKGIVVVIMFFSMVASATEYASLKHDEVNLRTGAGERYPILWVYQEKNFPVEVLDSFELWRQIREKEGNLLKKNDSESSILAIVQPGVIARLEECPKGDYCKITVSDEANTKKGWFPRSSLWGLDKGEVVEK